MGSWGNELEKLMSSFNSFTPNRKFTYESSEKDISFFDLKSSLVSLSFNKYRLAYKTQ